MPTAVFKNKWLPYLLVLPQILVVGVFFCWPAFQSMKLSILDVSPFGDKVHFVGLSNFTELFTSPEYMRSVLNTLVFSLSVTIICLVVSLGLAVLASQKIKGLAAYRTALLWPYGIAPPVAGIIWMFMFHPAYGVVPYFFSLTDSESLNWLLNGQIAMFLVIGASVWTQLGYNIAFFIAGLELLPPGVLEAASIDGASSWQRFTRVTLPLLSPVTLFLVVMDLIFALFDTFGIINAVTQGGPGGATETMVFKAYRDGFLSMDTGSSTAQSVILMLVAIALTALQFRLTERRSSDDGK